MDERRTQRSRPKPHKIVIIFDGERPCCVAFVDEAQEKRILKILNEHRRIAN